jgi:subtilisin-like proprotein convertase family protein
MFNLLALRGRLDPTMATSGAIRGHSAAAAAFSVAAAPATAPGPFPNPFTTASVSETFTSDGPRRLLLNPDGGEITPGNRTSTGGIVRQKPDITAASGVSTSTPGFNPFRGTSAAAPHAAAIAALMLSAVPTLTPEQVRAALITTAVDIEAPGVDRDTGAGVVMAQPALAAVGATTIATLFAGEPVPAQVSGDGDTVIEPNEIWEIAVPVTNIGGAGASAITATLTTSTAGAVILSGSSTYANLASGATGTNAVPFRIRVGSVCGAAIDLAFTVAYGGGPLASRTFHFSLFTGSAGTPVSFTYSGPVVPIPDGTPDAPGAQALAPLDATGAGHIHDVRLSLDGEVCTSTAGATTVGLDHSFVGDLRIELLAPDGTGIVAIDRVDGGGNNFCQTVLDDAAANSIQSVVTANAPFTGSFRPREALSNLRGKPVAGTWQLAATDFERLDRGNIRAWSLAVTPAVCDAPNPAPTIVAPPNQRTLANQTLGPIGFTVADAFDPPEALLVSASSSNPAVVANGGITLGGAGAVRTISITPVPDATGLTTITLAVSDGISTTTATFAVAVIGPAVPTEIGGFFAYDPAFTGGVRVAAGDVTGDGHADLITAPGPGGGPHVRALDLAGGADAANFYAYLPNFTGGVTVAVGDVNGDGVDDIVTGAGAGGGPHVRAFSLAGGVPTEAASFYAYPPDFLGGVTVAVGDVNGDGVDDIVTGAGAGGGPHVRAFSLAGGVLTEAASFYAYAPGFLGGVTVAVGDVNGDGVDDIVTGAGAGGGPHVRAFSLSGGGLAEVASFFAYDPVFLGGVNVAVGDVNGDGVDDLVTGAGAGGGPHVRTFTMIAGAVIEVANFYAYLPGFFGGVNVAVGDVNGDGVGDIITGPGGSGGPHVRAFSLIGP